MFQWLQRFDLCPILLNFFQLLHFLCLFDAKILLFFVHLFLLILDSQKASCYPAFEFKLPFQVLILRECLELKLIVNPPIGGETPAQTLKQAQPQLKPLQRRQITFL